MAVTIVRNPASVQLPPVTRMNTYQLVFSGSYSTGGEAVSAANLGMTVISQVQASESPIAYAPNILPVSPQADGSFTIFSITWEDGTGAGAVVQLAAGAYPAPITGGFLYLLVLGR